MDSEEKPWRRKRDLPRLSREWYQGRAWVFWTHTVENRAVGWLDNEFHAAFREELLHAQVRESLACPLYILMPDHIHLLWIGTRRHSDQILGSRFLRRRLGELLHPAELQKQGHDHVLREDERGQAAFGGAWSYTAMNPERAGLVADWRSYPYLGSLVPGYVDLDPRHPDFFVSFWKVLNAFSTRDS